MTFLIISIIALLLLVIANVKRLNVASRRMMLLFVGYWGIAMTLSSIGVPGLNRPGDFTFMLLLFNVLMFSVGFLLPKPSKSEFSLDEEDIHRFVNRIVDSRIFLIVLIFSTVFSAALFYVMRSVLAIMGDLGEVRTMFFEGSLYGAAVGWIIKLFLNPLHYVCIPLFGYMLFFRRDWKFIILTIFLLTFTSLDGGRFGYLRIAVGVLFVVFCMLNQVKITTKQKVLLVVAMVGFVYMMALVSQARSDKGEKITTEAVSSFSSYLCGPLTALDYAVENNYIQQMGGYTYGRLTFSSVDDVIYLFGRVLGYRFYNPMPKLVEIKQETPISVGDSSWNALYTAVLYFWLDGGVLGCIILPFLLGLGFRYLIKVFYKFRTWQLFVLVAMFFQLNMHSVCDFSFSDPFLLTFVVFLYVSGKKRIGVNRYVKIGA